eukprot:TRINITY_DN11650_c0_g1_i2.p1 TRINITY_DN11650_c0_g1~~TRINITY_DN11650_c0_g1_i2.p1  ORF type:complete len:338 (-),score=42.33 TRINITY_DN11650_c0_g1_i2:54-1067(-)
MTDPRPQSLNASGVRRGLPSAAEDNTSAKRQKPDAPVSTAPVRGDTCFKERLLSLQGFTGYPHLLVKWLDGSYYDAVVERCVSGGVKVGYTKDGSSEIIDLADDKSFERMSACRDLDFRDLEDACTAAADEDPQSSDQEDESSEVYEVEKILGKRMVKNKVEYLVSWKGYNSEHNSFEPKSNLADCKRIITDFEKAAESAAEAESRAVAAASNNAVVVSSRASGKKSWQQVEEQWIASTGPAADAVVHYTPNYKSVPEQGTARKCCAKWHSVQCQEPVNVGKGYCAHHLAVMQNRMLGLFVNNLSPREELKLMREQDDHRGQQSVPCKRNVPGAQTK